MARLLSEELYVNVQECAPLVREAGDVVRRVVAETLGVVGRSQDRIGDGAEVVAACRKRCVQTRESGSVTVEIRLLRVIAERQCPPGLIGDLGDVMAGVVA